MLLSEKKLISIEEAASRLDISEEAIVHKGIAGELSCCVLVRENVTGFISGLSSISDSYESLVYKERDKYFIEQFYRLNRQELKAMLYRQEGCIVISEFTVTNFFTKNLSAELKDQIDSLANIVTDTSSAYILDTLYIPLDEVGFFEHPNFESIDITNFPEELKTIIQIYLEYWHKLPDDMNRPSFENFDTEIRLKYKLPEYKAKRYWTLCKTKKQKDGGLFNPSLRPYKKGLNKTQS